MPRAMGAVELLGIAGSLSLLAGWRLYAVVLAVGAVVRLRPFELPPELAGLDVLGNPWVLGIAALGALVELFADKIAFIDSLWDSAHTLIRPIGGALLATAVVSPADPAWQVATLLLGGGAALYSHAAKAGTRALVNTSPEPLSNVAVSTIEDVGTAGSLVLLYRYPEAAIALAAVLAVLAGIILWLSWHAMGRIWALWKRTMPPSALDRNSRGRGGR